MTTENTNNHGPEIITRETDTPWSIVRDLPLSDGSTIEAVTITATRVDYFGQECEVAEWHADLTRFNGLTSDLLDEALDAASDIMAATSYRLSNAATVLADGAADADHEARWEAEALALEAAISDLARLDRNGASMATDGSLDGYTMAEQLEIVREAIRTIKANA
jgi:hypothetical protein